MIERTGDIWTLAKLRAVTVTCNGYVNRRGAAVMGRGIAREAANRWPQLPFDLGAQILRRGNHVFDLGEYFAIKDIPFPPRNYNTRPDARWHLFTFPVKHKWNEFADCELISRSVEELKILTEKLPVIYMTRPGCGNGGLEWDEVKPLLAGLDDRFIVVNKT